MTERDQRLLALLCRFRLLSRDQIMTLSGFGSVTRVNTRLAALVRAKLLSRKQLPIYPGKGSAQALYFLGAASRSFVEAHPEALAGIVRRISRWDLRLIEHVITANQLLVAAISALGAQSDPRLISFRTEPELRQVFSGCALVPDGWFAFEHANRRFNCFFEIDLHHEGLGAWRTKALHYLEYGESGRHEERFGFRSFRVLVLAKSKERLRNLRQIGEAAGRLFVYAELGAINAETIFGAVWLRASAGPPIGLMEA